MCVRRYSVSDFDFGVDDRPGRDDPVWEYVLQTRLQPYIEHARKWWAAIEDMPVYDTGIYDIPDSPPGMRMRFTRTAIRSPIRGIQAFPFVQTAYLQITGIQGGSVKMIDRVCLDNKFKIDEFTIVCKSNLPSTIQQGQLVAFIPTALLEDTKLLGQWLYLKQEELSELVRGRVPESVVIKAMLKA